MPKLAINGGPRECANKWPSWPVWDKKEERALLGVLRSGKWHYGERVREFERKFAEFQNAAHGITTTNGTTGLEISLINHGLKPGDEVIVPAYTFIATAGAAVRLGFRVVFADILSDNLCIDPEDVERKIGPKTRAIIPVHFAGHIADMDRLREIAARKNLVIVEDACHAWGSQWKGKGAGALGNCGSFSFQISKNITAGDGGIILTDDAGLADRIRAYTHVGRREGHPWYAHFTPATNAKMTEFQAAILLAQLERLKAQTLKRQANAAILDEGLGRIPGISVVKNDGRHTRRAYHFYAFRIDEGNFGVSRKSFLSALDAEGVPCMAGYGHAVYENPLFTGKEDGAGVECKGAPCPEAEKAARDCCWIMHQNLLAPASAMRGIVRAAGKIARNVEELRRR